MNRHLGNITGAFADSAILLPLVILLTQTAGYSAPLLLASAGTAYLIAGWIFRVPMSVQPLKSIAIAAITLGASQLEIQMSGAILAIVCLALTLFNANELAKKIPASLVQGLQAGLGVLLIIKGTEPLLTMFWQQWLTVAIVIIAIFWSSYRFSFPLLGIIATLGVLWTFFNPQPFANTTVASTTTQLRWDFILMLVLPQIALTLTNSVVGTHLAAQKYFGTQANRVTPNKLLLSIGLGNLLSALVAGLPFCHGAGGLTAHVKGGSRHWYSNWIIGSVLLVLALAIYWSKYSFALQYPPLLLSILLISVGIFHLQLAQPTWQLPQQRPGLLLMLLAVIFTQNLLWALAVGIVYLAILQLIEINFRKVV